MNKTCFTLRRKKIKQNLKKKNPLNYDQIIKSKENNMRVESTHVCEVFRSY